MKYIIITLAMVAMLSGCTTLRSPLSASESMYGGDIKDADVALADRDTSAMPSGRMLIWTGSIALDVINLDSATEYVTALTKKMGGYVEASESDLGSTYYAPSVTLKLRLPTDKLESTLGGLEKVGTVTSKSLSSKDVTESYVDTEARLATQKQLRDRLQKLLDKADKVEDVLAIEKELTRVQSDIDAKTALLKSLKSKVDYASLTVTLEGPRVELEKVEQILGPVGFLWEGSKWCVRKLFVWREESIVESPKPEPVVIVVGVENTSQGELSDPIDHVVYPGETVDSIARQYGVSMVELRKVNGLGKNGEPSEGQRLKIPISE